MYEIIEDFKSAHTREVQEEIFRSFCSCLWSSSNKRKIYTKSIYFKIKKELLDTDLGRIFYASSRIEYKYYKKIAKDKGWTDILRQKINNIYTRYFDPEIILSPEYMELIKTPKNLYYSWLNGASLTADEASGQIQQAMDKACLLKERLKLEKMSLPWNDYKKLIERYLYSVFCKCRLMDEFEASTTISTQPDFITEDNFYVKYFCRCLDGEIRNYQKKYYGLRSHKAYGRCKDCGSLYERKTRNQYRCTACQAAYNRKNKTEKQKKYRVEKRKNVLVH